MSKTILDIGGVPVFIGQYVAGAYYHHLHRVTHLGSEFQAKVDGYLAEPVVLQDGWQHPVWNEEEWQVISNGTDAMVIANTVNRVYTITETAWANLQERVEDYKTFCQHHLGWAVDVVEDGYVPPVPPEPEPPAPTEEWTFGGSFPIIFGGGTTRSWKFGDTFPIIYNN